MTYSSTLTSKNKTTLPKAVVTLLGAKPASILAYEVLEDGAVLLTAKSNSFKDIADSFPKKKPAKPVTVADIKKAVMEGAARRLRKAQ
ncbi:MAG: prlF antitoxin for toxin YhaV toxin [Verrucomicrobiaceae bacterium]|nr:prlF antitoxin for toxin YhaV toxin [Verrucomicrobiaceae bacterium]